MLKDIAIYGAGGLGREIVGLIKAINRIKPTWNMIGFFDDGIKESVVINHYPILGDLQTLNSWPNSLSLVMAIGNPEVKQAVVEKITNKSITYPTLVHPTVVLYDPDFIEIGIGCILFANSILTTNVRINNFVYLNNQCVVSHDVVIGEFSSFMSSVIISGEVTIGKGVYGGTGAKIINQKNIGDYSVIGAGAVVVKDVPKKTVVAGVPARIIKYRE